jgi:hypothetical protein
MAPPVHRSLLAKQLPFSPDRSPIVSRETLFLKKHPLQPVFDKDKKNRRKEPNGQNKRGEFFKIKN